MGKPTYAPMPMRFVADLRLTAEHIRVLGVVAGHDRFAKNEQNCNADHKELARKAGCHPKSLSRSLKALVKFGYVEVMPSPEGKIHRAYRVNYNDADTALMARPKAIKNVTKEDLIDDSPATCQEGSTGNKPATYTGNKPATKNALIGNNGVFKSQQIQCLKTPYNRYSEANKRLRETLAQKKVLRDEEKDSGRTHCEGDPPGRYQRRIAAILNGSVTTIATRTMRRGNPGALVA